MGNTVDLVEDKLSAKLVIHMVYLFIYLFYLNEPHFILQYYVLELPVPTLKLSLSLPEYSETSSH